jgi:hypothetical protein
MRLTMTTAFAAAALAVAACGPETTPDEAVEATTDAAPEAAAEAAPEERDVAQAEAPAADRKAPAKQAADEDDPEQAEARALADRLMTALGYDVMTASIPDVFADASARSLTSCTPATPTADVRELMRVMREELTAAMPRYYERIRDSYVRRLSVEELQALVDFYETPVGQEIAEAAAELTYDQFNAQAEIDAAGLRAYERLGWCDNKL